MAPDSKRHVCGVYTSVYGDKTCYFSFLVSVLNGWIEPGTWWWSWCILIKYCVCTHPVQDYPLYMGVPTGGVRSLLRLLLLQCDVGGSTDAPHLLGSSNIANVLQVYLQQGACFCLYGYLFKLKRAKVSERESEKIVAIWQVTLCLRVWLPLIFFLFSVAYLQPIVGRWWQERWRGGWYWHTEGKKTQTESHKCLWSPRPRPGQWPLTHAYRQKWRGGKWTADTWTVLNKSC